MSFDHDYNSSADAEWQAQEIIREATARRVTALDFALRNNPTASPGSVVKAAGIFDTFLKGDDGIPAVSYSVDLDDEIPF